MRGALSFGVARHRTALVAGGILVAAVLMFVSTPRPSSVASSPASLVAPPTVVIASRTIAAGNVIGANDIGTITIHGQPPSGAIFSTADAAGRMAQRDLKAGTVLQQIDLRDMASLGIAARLAPGERAFSIRVAEDDIVGGFLQSGDHIDIFATLPGSVFPAKTGEQTIDRSRVELLLQDVSVLAVGENLNTNGAVQPGARTVSVALAPEQLARLTLALRLGKVSLAIRKPGDNRVRDAASATLQDLVSGIASTPVKVTGHAKSGIPFYAGTRAATIDWKAAP